MDLLYLFRVLLKRKWIIIGTAVVAAGVAFLITRNLKRLYKSTAQFSTGFSVSDELKGSNDNFNYYEADTKFNNVIVTLNSPPLFSLLSYKLILHDLKDPANAFRQLSVEDKNSELYREVNKAEAIRIFQNKLDSMEMLSSYVPEEKKLLKFLELYKYDYSSLLDYLYVYRLERTDFIQIDFQSENPELSAFVVNTVFDQFLRFYRNIRSEKSEESIDTLRSLVDKKKQILDLKNAAVQQAGLTNTDEETKSNFNLITQMESSLSDEKDKQTSNTFNLQKINQRIADLNNTTVDNLSSAAQNSDLLAVKKQMNEAYLAYLNSGSSDPALLNKYNQYKAQYQSKWINLSGGKGSDVNKNDLLDQKSDLEAEIEASNVNIQRMQEKINELKGNVASAASQSATSQTLLNEADLAEKDYLAAKQNLSDAQDVNYASVNNFRQTLVGLPAIDPEPSKRLLIVGMAGMSGLVFTILFIVLLVYLDSSIKTPAIFARTVNLRLLTMINHVNFKNKKLFDIITTKPTLEKGVDNRQNVFRESLRKLRYEIERSGKKIFLFTSAKKGEGKTTLIQALSYSMSLSKKKILIIDTNFCNNDLTMQLHVDAMLEKIDPKEKNLLADIKNMVTDVGAGTVYVIGCESGDYTPSEILPRENILNHLHELTAEYDFIFLEGPPLNDFTDSKELAEYVDGVIAVFSATRNIRQIDKESIEFFKSLNGKFCGSILNKVELEDVNVS